MSSHYYNGGSRYYGRRYSRNRGTGREFLDDVVYEQSRQRNRLRRDEEQGTRIKNALSRLRGGDPGSLNNALSMATTPREVNAIRNASQALQHAHDNEPVPMEMLLNAGFSPEEAKGISAWATRSDIKEVRELMKEQKKSLADKANTREFARLLGDYGKSKMLQGVSPDNTILGEGVNPRLGPAPTSPPVSRGGPIPTVESRRVNNLVPLAVYGGEAGKRAISQIFERPKPVKEPSPTAPYVLEKNGRRYQWNPKTSSHDIDLGPVKDRRGGLSSRIGGTRELLLRKMSADKPFTAGERRAWKAITKEDKDTLTMTSKLLFGNDTYKYAKPETKLTMEKDALETVKRLMKQTTNTLADPLEIR